VVIETCAKYPRGQLERTPLICNGHSLRGPGASRAATFRFLRLGRNTPPPFLHAPSKSLPLLAAAPVLLSCLLLAIAPPASGSRGSPV
jgi:hypothetical protein